MMNDKNGNPISPQTAQSNSGGLGNISIGGAAPCGPYQPAYPARQACPNCGYCPHCGRGNGYYQQPYYYYGNVGGNQAIPMGSTQGLNQNKF